MNMKVSRNWLQTYFEKEIPSAAALSDLFTFHSFEVEDVENIATAAGSAGMPADNVIDVKVLPDRAHYCLSHKGIAEEIYVCTGLTLKKKRDTGTPPEANTKITPPKIVMDNAAGDAKPFCRRYIGRRIENIKVGDSPVWMKTYLGAIGERSINNIVDAGNLIMFDIGQPLHIFDADKVSGAITVRAARAGEKIALLDGREEKGKEVVLKSTDYVVADEAGPLAIAGVKGGKIAAVTSATKNIIIESANFEPSAVRRTSTRLNLRNESSKRFENEITPELASEGMKMISALIAELVPESRVNASEIVDVYPQKPAQTIIKISREFVSARLGVEIPQNSFDEILARLGVTTDGQIPYHRLDLTIPEDLVEEIGRIYGYEKITGTLPPAPIKPITVLPSFYVAEKIKNILTELGFSEVYTYTLVSSGEIETAHPIASDKAFARANLTDGVLESVKKNATVADLLELDAIKVFEIGRTFTKNKESTTLALGAAQIKKVKGKKSEDLIIAGLNDLYTQLGTPVPANLSSKLISKNQCAVYQIDLDEIVKSWTSTPDAATVSYADLGFGPASSVVYEKISSYPFIVRDIAVFVPVNSANANAPVSAENVWQGIMKGITLAGAQKLLNKYSLYSNSATPKTPFDTFEKDSKKSYAFRLVFQSMEKTLTDVEANAIMEKVYAQMKENGWEVR